MGWFSDDSDQANAYDQVVNAPHKAELSHELIAAAASYEVSSLSILLNVQVVNLFFRPRRLTRNTFLRMDNPQAMRRPKSSCKASSSYVSVSYLTIAGLRFLALSLTVSWRPRDSTTSTPRRRSTMVSLTSGPSFLPYVTITDTQQPKSRPLTA